jgi:hypothetical protein
MSSSAVSRNGTASRGDAVRLTLATMADRPLAFAVELERRAALKRARDRRYRARKRARSKPKRVGRALEGPLTEAGAPAWVVQVPSEGATPRAPGSSLDPGDGRTEVLA